MFIVKNVTNQQIEIPELRVVLAPDEKLDLDMVASRFYIDQSRNLRACFNGKKLLCVFKDDGTKAIKPVEVNNEQVSTSVKNIDVIDAVKQLEDKLTKRLDEKVANQQPQVDMNVLNQALAALQSLVNNTQNPQTAKTAKIDDTSISDVDEKRLIDIQKRTVNRLVNKAESNVKHEEQITNTDVNKNVNELEGLL